MPQSTYSEANSSPVAQEINSHNKLTGISVTDTSNPYNHGGAKKTMVSEYAAVTAKLINIRDCC
jgi:hypothetical protein